MMAGEPGGKGGGDSGEEKGKRKAVDGRDRQGAKRGKGRHHHAQHKLISGPGVFVSCVRGKERKAGEELIEYLEEIADRHFSEASRRTKSHDDESGDGPDEEKEDFEAQIRAELKEIKGEKGGGGRDGSKAKGRRRFCVMSTDVECLIFVSVARPIDPVALTCAMLDDVRRTGLARSRFVHRISPVADVVRADMASLNALAKDEIQRSFLNNDREGKEDGEKTYKVEVKMRLHDRMKKADVIDSIAAHMPSTFTAKLDKPSFVVNVEVIRMLAGVAILPKFEQFRRYNPLMLAEQAQNARQVDNGDDAPSRVGMGRIADAR